MSIIIIIISNFVLSNLLLPILSVLVCTLPSIELILLSFENKLARNHHFLPLPSPSVPFSGILRDEMQKLEKEWKKESAARLETLRIESEADISSMHEEIQRLRDACDVERAEAEVAYEKAKVYLCMPVYVYIS